MSRLYWRQRVQFCSTNKNENVSISFHERELKLVGLIHSTNGGRKRKNEGSELSRNQRTRDLRNYAPNPWEDTRFCLLILDKIMETPKILVS